MPHSPYDDPAITANILNNVIMHRNPVQVLWGSVTKKIQLLIEVPANIKRAQAHIDHLEKKVAYWESTMASVNVKDTGSRLNQLR